MNISTKSSHLIQIDLIDIFAEPADIAVVSRSEDAFCHRGEHEIPLKNRRLARRIRKDLPHAFLVLGGHDASREAPWFNDSVIDAIAVGTVHAVAVIAVIAVTGLVLAATVAERHQAETFLRASEASLANAQRIAQLGNWDLDRNTQQLRWSDEIYRILGQPPGAFEPSIEGFLEYVHPEDRELVKTSIEAALFQKQPYSIDYRLVLPDGSHRTVCEHAAVNSTYITSTVQDITDRKRAEAALRDKAKQLEGKLAELLRFGERDFQLALRPGVVVEVRECHARQSLAHGAFDRAKVFFLPR